MLESLERKGMHACCRQSNVLRQQTGKPKAVMHDGERDGIMNSTDPVDGKDIYARQGSEKLVKNIRSES